ncbi:MAG: hydroxyacylglutathione hydrolase [Methylicorpusculum sp.]|uniref:hydroxyacylglutathione hydrolase n=1 Tax=Methylicorpusculum sp. TaxID=2713644 RepID=UPI00271DBD2F|nr:hydroxyacylglutathione hydrolase [Methylicorpusculum sp.]MDO8939860.1 hydroxyacylglutathione hydrolase [Methylicorpusculum sp.]MDP2202957.1 hydroxyacylglutathione hydrolase [Methylicorpusculum sp.]
MLDIIQIPVLNDNYIYLLHDPASKETAVVDPALASPVLERLDQQGWKLNYIFNTHHHQDHVGGNLELKTQTGCRIIGAYKDRERIPGIDKTVAQGDWIKLGEVKMQVMETPGHTSGHIVYHAIEDRLLFCGDTLFAMGCGRLFEGTAEQLWNSLKLLRDLPDETKVYCAHEYTLNNGRFALTVEPDNQDLVHRLLKVEDLRKVNAPTIPSTIGLEKKTNPFFRADKPSLQTSVGRECESSLSIFTRLRAMKDKF